jgi:cysteine desulfurase
MNGGGHEFGLRSGTLNVPAIAGFGEASAISRREMADETARVRALRDRLRARIESGLTDIRVNGSWEHRLPGNLNLAFSRVNSEALLIAVPDLALSTGSACSSASVEPSHVLKALGDPEAARSSVRFGVGRFNTEEEIDYASDRLIQSVTRLRALAPVGSSPTPA